MQGIFDLGTDDKFTDIDRSLSGGKLAHSIADDAFCIRDVMVKQLNLLQTKSRYRPCVLAKIAVEPRGRVIDSRLSCSHDRGRLIVPGQIPSQCVGNLVWVISMILRDTLPVSKSQAEATNLDLAPEHGLRQIPSMHIALADKDSTMQCGVGETAIVASAIAIVIRDTTGATSALLLQQH